MRWDVRYHPLARNEADSLERRERRATDHAVEKLVALGPELMFPHSSKIVGVRGGVLRELRPRAGRSPWRCLYCRVDDVFVVLAVCREAECDSVAFARGVKHALARLHDLST